ncbi:dna mismatch repair protein msh3 [Lasallia pustulata]|uniref:DNA mismatch repair protein MSH3 n=1 Tax=Lasallia pustulata TaxID=136370 RepID=A0A1W5CSU6_9LECA|nr:dna mismatch repair protein msh3 [Lasallia pustulata]
MPSARPSSQPTASAKKQQSISSFFTKSPPTTKPPPTSTPKITTATESRPDLYNGHNARNESLFVSSDEDAPSTSRRTSRTPKRPLDHAEESTSLADGEESASLPTRKRLRRSNTQEDVDDVTHEDTSTTRAGNTVGSTLSSIAANAVKKPKVSERTSKYLFSSSPTRDEENVEVDEDAQRRKDKLHQKFVKKLGRPDSIAEIKRRNWHITEETEEAELGAEGEDDVEDEDVAPKAASKGKKGVAAKKGSSKLTPMEKQVLEIKRQNMDTLLIVEVGYKFRFFGEDARIAAKELSIVCIPGKFRYDEHSSEAHIDRFASASIPVHRLHVHVKRLVAAGHKVGVVRQLETAALKAAGDNRNAPFVRKLTNLYTKGTYIDDVEGLEGPVEGPSGGAPATGYLLCITENNAKGWGTDEKVHVGIVAVQPATGDVIYDDFEDGFMRSEIETRLLHIAPCEFLIVGDLSKATEKLVQHLSGSKTNVFGDKSRVERVDKPKTMAAQSYSHVSNFYAGKMKATNASEDEKASNLLDKVLRLAENVTICLSAMITHMSDYGLEHVFDLTKYFQSFSARSHMLLNGTTLTSLEVYQNQTDHSEKGSLFWTLDRTQTRFGQRLLRKWVGRPLLEKTKLEERIAAVEELKDGERTVSVDKIKHLLFKTKSDLEKSLIRIYYGKCTRPELLNVLQTMQRIANEFATVKSPSDAGFQSSMINVAVAALPSIAEDVVTYLERINPQAAKDDDKYAFFRDSEETEDITEYKLGIVSVEHELDAHRAFAAEKVRKKKVEYVTVAGIEYLIEMDNTQLKNVPASWAKISGTKKVSRFHTPEVVRFIRERDQHKEALAAACDVAFTALLADISAKYQSFRDCVQALATLDCLLSLATVASQPGYVKPEYTDETCIAVKQGRHPMVEQLLLDTYVPNDTDLASDRTRALLITGPNMGGKSSYVRQVALIAIMGQIGSYVPAESAKLGMLDAVFTRMGAFDNMMAGESTFMVELSETSDILKQATPRSLIILDELGRGTSTHDGVAIAQAVLDHVVRDTKSLTLFITHYQNLSALAKGFENGELKNVHMRFTEGGDGGQDITFLYEVAEGVAHRSYGLNVARLANVPPSVLVVAGIKSRELEDEVQEKKLGSISKMFSRVLDASKIDELDQLVTGMEQL